MKLALPDREPDVELIDHRLPLLLLIGLMIVTLMVALIGLAIDPRIITGAPAWLKPAKFAISIIIYAGTLWLLLRELVDHPRLVRVASWIVGIGLTVEMVLIALQAARGTTSHFNVATPFDALVFRVMGATIMAVWLLTMVVAAFFFRRNLLHPALTWGVRFGFIGAIIGMGLAIMMTFPTPEQQAIAGVQPLVVGAHAVGVTDGGAGLPIVGWSTEGGDLRVAHFVGLHAIQVLPIAALLIMRFAPGWLPARSQAQVVGILGVGWIALTLLLAWQALRGQPVVSPDSATTAALALLAGGVGIAIMLVFWRARVARADRQARAGGVA